MTPDKTPHGTPPATTGRKVFIKSYGCQMNVYDSQRMADALAPEGYVETSFVEDADLVILNTCHIREKASEKVYSELGRVRLARDARRAAGGDMTIAVAGCVAQAEGEEIVRRAPAVDLVFGPQTYHRLPDLVRAAQVRPGVVDTDFPVEDKFAILPRARPERTRSRGPAAFVTVQEGCDKFCTFCVVPYTRGSEVSRPVEAIVSEVDGLVRAGVREISLLGQNVNAYHGAAQDGSTATLAGLLRRLSAIEGIERLRYTTSHPRDMDAALIAAHGEIEALMPFLHLPVQSGSDAILAAMNRRHGRDDYLRIVDAMRRSRPDIAFSSDFIVGFPGETDADFAQTLSLIETVGFASAYSFKYSPRPGTPGAGLAQQVPEAVKSERLAILQDDHRAPAEGIQPALRGPANGCAPRASWQQARPARRPLALSAGRAGGGAGGDDRPDRARVDRGDRDLVAPWRDRGRQDEGGGRLKADEDRRTRTAPQAVDGPAELTLVFEDNRVATLLFGQHDQHLAFVERRLGIEATARGNHVALRGPRDSVEQAKRVLEGLYARLKAGQSIGLGDVEGALRMSSAQGVLFSAEGGPRPVGGAATVGTRKKTIAARTHAQDDYIKALQRFELVFATGPAGTGKTYLAVAHAAALIEKGEADRLILSRPAVEAGERLGFLPGDMREKVDPYLRPLYDALYDMMPPERVERGLQSGMIEIAPLAFMRGRTLANSIVLLDEAQNCTTMQMKMFLTRLGEGSRMIITGDPSQIDLPPGQKSGLVEAVELLKEIAEIAICRFTSDDVVRHELVAKIVRAYESRDGRA